MVDPAFGNGVGQTFCQLLDRIVRVLNPQLGHFLQIGRKLIQAYGFHDFGDIVDGFETGCDGSSDIGRFGIVGPIEVIAGLAQELDIFKFSLGLFCSDYQ